MPDRWPPREELCALVQERLSHGIGLRDDDIGTLVNAIRQRGPYLSHPTALHIARMGHITYWAPQPLPARIDSGDKPPALTWKIIGGCAVGPRAKRGRIRPEVGEVRYGFTQRGLIAVHALG